MGKIGIAGGIRLKPGTLTADERLIIRQHAAIGAKILSSSQNSVIQMSERIALWHHENWDGSGYPHGLKGEKIPLEARIVGLVDVYDALRSDRVYRRGLEEQAVLDLLERGRGRKFEPGLLDLFLKHLPEIQSLQYMGPDMNIAAFLECANGKGDS